MSIFQGFAAGTALAAGACLLRSEYEKNQLSAETFFIRSEKLSGPEKTFVFLSDLHNKEFGEENRRLLQAVRRAEPDAVLIGGDMMISKGGADVAVPLRLLKELSQIAPVYYGEGNHESRMKWERETYGDLYERYREEVRRLGVIWLSDAHISFGNEVEIYGLALPKPLYRPGYPRMAGGFLEQRLGKPDPGKFSILLAHSPMFFKEYAAWGADLSLSGHFHGGTIRLPVVGGVMTPQYQFFYPWCAGQFERDGRQMIVSRGLGTHSVNVRLWNKPQVVVVKLRK